MAFIIMTITLTFKCKKMWDASLEPASESKINGPNMVLQKVPENISVRKLIHTFLRHS